MGITSSSGVSCHTAGLDNPDKQDYIAGQSVRFWREWHGLDQCYQADIGGVPKGGSVTWLGSGVFAARYREICLDMASGEDGPVESWCCEMRESSSAQNNAVLMDNCQLAEVIVSTVETLRVHH